MSTTSRRPWREGQYGRALLVRDEAGFSLASWMVDPVSAAPLSNASVDVETAGRSVDAALDLTPSGYWYSDAQLSADAVKWLASRHPELHRVESPAEQWSLAARRVLSEGEMLGQRHRRAPQQITPTAPGAGKPDRFEELVHHAATRRLLPPQTLKSLVAAASPVREELWLLLDLVVRADRRRRRLARLRFSSDTLRAIAAALLVPTDESARRVSAACEISAGPVGRPPIPWSGDEALFWATFGDAVVAALASPLSRRRTLAILDSGQLELHVRIVATELGVQARLPVLVLDDDDWLTDLLGSPAEALVVPGHTILLGATAAGSTVRARRAQRLSRVLVHELVHAGQRLDARRPLPPALRLAQELLVEGATEIVTNRVIAAAQRSARDTGRASSAPDALSDIAYHSYVVLCGAVLQVAFLTEMPPGAAVEAVHGSRSAGACARLDRRNGGVGPRGGHSRARSAGVRSERRPRDTSGALAAPSARSDPARCDPTAARPVSERGVQSRLLHRQDARGIVQSWIVRRAGRSPTRRGRRRTGPDRRGNGSRPDIVIAL